MEEIEKSEGKSLAALKSLDFSKSSDASNSMSKTAKSISLVKDSFKLDIPSTSAIVMPKQTPPESPFMSPNESPMNSPIKSRSPLLSPKSSRNSPRKETQINISQLPEKPQLYEPYNLVEDNKKIQELNQELEIRNKLVKTLEENNSILKSELRAMMVSFYFYCSFVRCLKHLNNIEIKLDMFFW